MTVDNAVGKPRMDTDERGLDALTEAVIGSAFRVSNVLGAGFLEKAYENALAFELRKTGLRVEQQRSIEVRYDGQIVGAYFADLLVEDVLLVELKAAKALDDIHMAQCIDYLKAAGLRLCLLLNFGQPRVQIRRIRNDLT